MVCVRVDPSVTSIPAKAFEGRKKLTKVELHEGLIEIGDHSFANCDHSITKINIPNSIKRINDLAFYDSLRTTIRLHDDIESIGLETFSCCIFTNFRVPPLISAILDHCYITANPFSLWRFQKTSVRLDIMHSAIVTAYETWPFRPMLSLVMRSLFQKTMMRWKCIRIFGCCLVQNYRL